MRNLPHGQAKWQPSPEQQQKARQAGIDLSFEFGTLVAWIGEPGMRSGVQVDNWEDLQSVALHHLKKAL